MKTDKKLLLKKQSMHLGYTSSPSDGKKNVYFRSTPQIKHLTFGTQGYSRPPRSWLQDSPHFSPFGNEESACSMQNAIQRAMRYRTCQSHLPAETTLHMCCSSCRRYLQRHITFADRAPISQPLHTHFDESLKSHKEGWGWKPTGSFYGKVWRLLQILNFPSLLFARWFCPFRLCSSSSVIPCFEDSFNHPSTIQWVIFLLFWCVSTIAVVVIPNRFLHIHILKSKWHLHTPS